ncbi:MAG TPA: amidase [Candidatus Binatia bacterium]|nr:amidase [Candidatus Binatia bacterium]
MPNVELLRLSLAEAADRVRRGDLSPVDLASAVYDQIERLNPELNAFTTLVPRDQVMQAARRAADEIAHGRYLGPLHGIPASVKDLIDTAGLRTTYGSGMFADHVPASDGGMPERLKALGAIVTGKTATHELGLGLTTNNFFFGATRNPWNRDHVPGGSSGGASAAAAALMGPLHVGTDGGGSIRFPAAFCGVVGHKPTLGLLSIRGQFGGEGTSFSVPGPLVRSVRDAALASQLLAGFDPAYLYSLPHPVPDLLGELERGVEGLRIGVSDDLLVPEPDPDVRAAYEATVRRLADLGARIVQIALPSQSLVLRGVMGVFGIEGGTLTDRLIGDRPKRFSPQVEMIRSRSLEPDPGLWIDMQRDRQRIARGYAEAFCEVDAIVSPVSPFKAPRIDQEELALTPRAVPYTGAANLVGFPAVSLPAGSSEGLPLAIQVIAPTGEDGRALRIAFALERAHPDHRVAIPPAVA